MATIKYELPLYRTSVCPVCKDIEYSKWHKCNSSAGYKDDFWLKLNASRINGDLRYTCKHCGTEVIEPHLADTYRTEHLAICIGKTQQSS